MSCGTARSSRNLVIPRIRVNQDSGGSMMKQWNRFTCVALVASLGLSAATAVTAQEIRIYTTIRDVSGNSSAVTADHGSIVVRSLMLFHAGKVYDYIEPAREVTVYEPAHRRFTVLNPRRQLCSELTHDEIRQFLGLAEDEAQKRLAFVPEESSASSRRALEFLRFQFQPDFESNFDNTKQQLKLSADNFEYVVEGFQPETPEVVEKYLQVADWMAQFNSVLHPQSLFPAPRLKLNQELRSRGLLPLTISLKAETDPVLHLQAKHEWTWKFQKTDRQLIDNWDKQLRDPNLRKLPFREFQKEMLRAEIARKR